LLLAGEAIAQEPTRAREPAGAQESGDDASPQAKPEPTEPAKKAPKKAAEPSAEEPGTRTYLPLAFTGIALFGASWIGTIITAAAADPVADRGQAVGHAVVPIAGPFLLFMQGSGPQHLEGLIIAFGAAQGLGLLGTFLGLTLESKVVPVAAEATIRPILAPTFGGVHGAF
jgi:hypothetical protein